MFARVLHMVALQGGKLMGETLGDPYHPVLSTRWAVEVADVFLGIIRHHVDLWRLLLAIRLALADLATERLCSASPSIRPLLEAGLELLRLIVERATASWLQCTGGPRWVFRCAKSWDEEGTLVLSDGLVSNLLTASFEPLRLIFAYFLCLSATMFPALDALSENRSGLRAVHLLMGQLGGCV